MTRDRREQIEKLIREHVKCDATGLAPAVASVFLVGFEDAAEAIAAALPEVGEVEHRVCAGCGSSWSAATLRVMGKVSCCPDRKMLTAKEWAERAEAAEHARDEAVAEIERLNGALIAEQEHTDRLQSENATMAIKMAGLDQECVASMEEIAALRNDLDNALSRLERAKEALSEVRQWAKNMKGRTDCTRLQFREVCAEIEDRAASALQLMGGER